MTDNPTPYRTNEAMQLDKIEAKLDRLLALFGPAPADPDEDGAAFVRSLEGKTVEEMVALNRARNKRLGVKKTTRKATP